MFAFHAGVLPGGFVGVDVFFAISGFLITGLALAEIETTGRLGLGAFWARRARRLLPALFLLVATVLAVAAATGVGRPGLRRDVVAALAYVANWTRNGEDHDYFAAYEEPPLLEHTWSLAVEEQFYLVWPLVLVGVLWALRGRADRLRPTLLVVSGALAVGSTSWAWWLADTGRAPLNRLYFGTDTRAVGLAAGCLLACVLARGERTAERDSRGAVTAGATIGFGTLVVVAVVVDGSETWMYGPGFALVAAASVALVTAASGRGIVARALAVRPLPSIGRVSYGIYLWHWPIIVTLDRERTGLDGVALGVLWVAATAVATALSWWLVERRAPMPRLVRPRVIAAYAVTAGAIALASFAVVDTVRPDLDPSLLAATAPLLDASPTTAAPAEEVIPDAPPIEPRPVPDDTGASVGTTRPVDRGDPVDDDDRFDVLVLGDSVAESLGPEPPAPLVVDGRAVRVVNHGIVACPVHPEGRWRYDDGTRADDPVACEGPDRFDAIVADADPDLIVLLFGWPGTIAGRELDDGRVVAACDEEHDRRWAAGHVDLATRYADVAPVVAATVAPPQTFVDADQQDRHGCLDRALRASGVTTFEWGEWLCPEGDCRRAAGLRRDPVHFARDEQVLDVVWRQLVAAATAAAAAAER